MPSCPIRLTVIVPTVLLTGSMAALGNEWSRQNKPRPGPARVFGSYAAGCIVGAESLPPHGPGFQVMGPDRNRYHGHPRLTAFIRALGHRTDTRGSRIVVGDLSQPLGGAIPGPALGRRCDSGSGADLRQSRHQASALPAGA